MEFHVTVKCCRLEGERRQSHEHDWRVSICVGSDRTQERIMYGESEARVRELAQTYIQHRQDGCSPELAKRMTLGIRGLPCATSSKTTRRHWWIV